MKEQETKKAVREGYAKIAREQSSCCDSSNSCCSSTSAETISKQIGYSEEELASVPEGANLGLGCGNPLAIASLKEGETVVDLGSGAGFDCFLASERVGEKGLVIGVDMTPVMLDKARDNALKGNYNNVEFRLGEIENLPVADDTVDAIISNCVINLSTDKERVFREAFRILKPGGRISISDIVLTKKLPEKIMNSISAYVGCLSGAMLKGEYLKAIKYAGFTSIRVTGETRFPINLIANDPTAQAIAEGLDASPQELLGMADSILSIKVSAGKPV
jgi:SAM-dependent methyltransferase